MEIIQLQLDGQEIMHFSEAELEPRAFVVAAQ